MFTNTSNEFHLRKVKTQVLKVHINCDGCKRKVKKLLRRIEGVYTVDIDTEQHKVIVTGTVDSDTLVKKLGRSGKHAEIWPPNYTFQNQNQEQDNWIIDGNPQNQMQRPIKGLKGPKRSRPMLDPSTSTFGPEAKDGLGYYGGLDMTDGMEQTMGGGDGYAIDGDGIYMQDNMESMMGNRGFQDNGVGIQHLLPSHEYHHHNPRYPPYMMMGNMQGPQYKQPFPMMMNMDMQAINNPMMMNHYMHVNQPPMMMNMDMHGMHTINNPMMMNFNHYMHVKAPTSDDESIFSEFSKD